MTWSAHAECCWEKCETRKGEAPNMSERGVVFRSRALEKEVYRRICGFMKMLAVYYIVLVVNHQKLSP